MLKRLPLIAAVAFLAIAGLACAKDPPWANGAKVPVTPTPTPVDQGIEIKFIGEPETYKFKEQWWISDDWDVKKADGTSAKSVHHTLILASYDLEIRIGEKGRMAIKPIKGNGQIRLFISLIDAEGAKPGDPPTVGVYATGQRDFSRVYVADFYQLEGQLLPTSFYGDASGTGGSVTITSATADSVAGQIDLQGSDRRLRGSFTAKPLKQTKK